MTTNGVVKKHASLADLEKQCLDDSIRWFGDTVNIEGAIPHHALALAGEVGEFANIVKKIDRGSLDSREPRVRHDLAMELTDVLIYVLNLGALLRIDLEESYKIKRAENEQRFTAERARRREQRA
jgi:NTP pyrophosphatase (non-canonical NTP hydrolase)